MSTTQASDLDFSPNIREWAQRWLGTDSDYVKDRAQFAPEPVRSIAKLVLLAGDTRTANSR